MTKLYKGKIKRMRKDKAKHVVKEQLNEKVNRKMGGESVL